MSDDGSGDFLKDYLSFKELSVYNSKLVKVTNIVTSTKLTRLGLDRVKPWSSVRISLGLG